MKMILSMKILPLALLLIFSSCATKLTSSGEKVKLTKEDPGKKCKELEDVQVGAEGDLHAKNALRNLAADKGGNLVVMDTISINQFKVTQITGRVFKCDNL